MAPIGIDSILFPSNCPTAKYHFSAFEDIHNYKECEYFFLCFAKNTIYREIRRKKHKMLEYFTKDKKIRFELKLPKNTKLRGRLQKGR